MQPTGLAEQLLYCLRFAALGAALGLVYDLLRAVRIHFRLRRLGTALLDVFFCLLGLAGFLLAMLRGTDGRLRGYLPLGLAAGFWLYRQTVSAPVLRLELWLLKRLGQALGAVKDFFLWTFSFPRGN